MNVNGAGGNAGPVSRPPHPSRTAPGRRGATHATPAPTGCSGRVGDTGQTTRSFDEVAA